MVKVFAAPAARYCCLKIPSPEQMLESLWDTDNDDEFDEVCL